MPQYLGPAPVKKQATQRVFATLDKNGKMNPGSLKRMQDDMAQQELENEQDYQRQKLLYDSIKASNEFVPTRPGERYTDSKAYAQNRMDNRNLIDSYQGKKDALSEAQFLEDIRIADEQARKRQAQLDASRLIYSGNDPLAQKRILDAGRDVPEITPDYLKSIDMVNEAGTGLYGTGSSNFDLNEGFLGPSTAQRRDLKYYNTALESGQQADPTKAPSVRSMNEMLQTPNGAALTYAPSTVSQAAGNSPFAGMDLGFPGTQESAYSAASGEPSSSNIGSYGSAASGDTGANTVDVSGSALFKPGTKYGKKIKNTQLAV